MSHESKMAVANKEIEDLRRALDQERRTRVKLEEDMRQAFMRGVCALNLEAISVLKRGVPNAQFNAASVDGAANPQQGVVSIPGSPPEPRRDVADDEQPRAQMPPFAQSYYSFAR